MPASPMLAPFPTNKSLSTGNLSTSSVVHPAVDAWTDRPRQAARPHRAPVPCRAAPPTKPTNMHGEPDTSARVHHVEGPVNPRSHPLAGPRRRELHSIGPRRHPPPGFSAMKRPIAVSSLRSISPGAYALMLTVLSLEPAGNRRSAYNRPRNRDATCRRLVHRGPSHPTCRSRDTHAAGRTRAAH